jgi:transmembrane sensor
LQGLRADLHTATGERCTFNLTDGSIVLLNARSVVDLDFAAGKRRIHLLSGELIATVTAKSSLTAGTSEGAVQSEGTRFIA